MNISFKDKGERLAVTMCTDVWYMHCVLCAAVFLRGVSVLADQMMDLVRRECQRHGALAVLGEGTGAQLLCPKRGVVLSRAEILGGSPDCPQTCTY